MYIEYKNSASVAASSAVIFFVFFFHSGTAHAQNTYVPDEITTHKAVVTQILDSGSEKIPGTDVEHAKQKIKVRILDGKEEGKEVLIDNDYLQLKQGDKFFVRHTVNKLDGVDAYTVSDPDRLAVLYIFIGLFVLCVILFGGKQGIRGLVALGMSFFLILYVLLPGIIKGMSPVLLSMGVSFLIVTLGSYITHGFNRVTSSAVVGMIFTIIVTGILAILAINFGHLTGFSSEEAVYLNMDTGGKIDFAGLLLGAIMIGLLGVLYDAAIGQAVSVDELNQVAKEADRKEIFKRALRIGREHVGALVNTLAIAYVGAALPLLLLFYNSSATVLLTINRELFATEILRTMIGSIGLVLAVPITTAVAVRMLVRRS